MPIVSLDSSNADAFLEQHNFVLICVVAPGCPACRAFTPVFERAAERHSDISFGHLNGKENEGLAQTLDVDGFPSLVVLRDQTLLLTQPGALSDAALADIIDRARGLDMDEVRRNMKQAESQD